MYKYTKHPNWKSPSPSLPTAYAHANCDMKLHHLHVSSPDEDFSSSSSSTSSSSCSSSFRYRRLPPLLPKITFSGSKPVPALDFVIKNASKPNSSVQLQSAATTRWNPSPEQIKVLDMLYRGGMRTPNAYQIELITQELGKYGRIEGKNVFYWFQNHKARERQKQKRAALLTPSTLDSQSLAPASEMQDDEAEEICDGGASCKRRRCKIWSDASLEVVNCTEDATLELFPLHPQGKA